MPEVTSCAYKILAWTIIDKQRALFSKAASHVIQDLRAKGLITRSEMIWDKSITEPYCYKWVPTEAGRKAYHAEYERQHEF